jgi:hypothetical protein
MEPNEAVKNHQWFFIRSDLEETGIAQRRRRVGIPSAPEMQSRDRSIGKNRQTLAHNREWFARVVAA